MPLPQKGKSDTGKYLSRIYVDEEETAVERFRREFTRLFAPLHNSFETTVFLCIGSDRSTGDALGPLVGERLKRSQSFRHPVYGTLEKPTHATNLDLSLDRIRENYTCPLLIAVDSSLGSSAHVGSITLRPGPLQPGSGVQKELPSVGDLHIAGTVNISGFMEFQVLQSTRLYLVVRMARIISRGLIAWSEREDAVIHTDSQSPGRKAGCEE